MIQFSLKYTPNISTAQPLQTDFKPPSQSVDHLKCLYGLLKKQKRIKKIRHNLLGRANLRYLSDIAKMCTMCIKNSTWQFRRGKHMENRSKQQQLWAKPIVFQRCQITGSLCLKKKVKIANVKARKIKNISKPNIQAVKDLQQPADLKRGCTARRQAENSKCGLT